MYVFSQKSKVANFGELVRRAPEELEALRGHFGKAWISTFDSSVIYRDRENVDTLADI